MEKGEMKKWNEDTEVDKIWKYNRKGKKGHDEEGRNDIWKKWNKNKGENKKPKKKRWNKPEKGLGRLETKQKEITFLC